MTYEKTDKSAQRKSRIVRASVLAVVVVLTTGISLAHQYVSGAAKPVGVDALCPFGGLETLYSLAAGGTLIKNIAISSIVLLIGALAVSLVWRRSFCGQLCPLGALQEAFGSLGKRIFGRAHRFTVPRWLDRPARLLKYAVLAVFLVWTWNVGELVMRPYDPWVTWAHLTSAELLTDFGIGLAVLVVALLGSIFYERFFCKYLCPTGAFLGIFSKVSFLRIHRDPEACIDCGICDRACPVNIAVATADDVTSTECLSCNSCVNACPAKGALEVTTPRGTALSPFKTTAIVIGLTLAVVGVATATNNFDWLKPSLATEIERTGAFDPSLIKGMTSLQEVADAIGVPVEEAAAAFGVPVGEAGVALKELKTTYGFTMEDVRLWAEERSAQAR